MDFQLLRFEAGFNSRRSISEYLQVNITTVNRWENGDIEPPFAVIELLNVLAGRLPDVGRNNQWQGWRFVDEYIYTPAGDKYTAGDIDGIRILHARLADSRATINKLNRKIESMTAANNDKMVADNVVHFANFKRN